MAKFDKFVFVLVILSSLASSVWTPAVYVAYFGLGWLIPAVLLDRRAA